MSKVKTTNNKNFFWKSLALQDLSQQQWESLCDGCAKCCTLKLEDEDDGKIYDTNVACQYLDQNSCTCQCYASRSEKVPGCVTLTVENLKDIYFMPKTCAYRLLVESKPLPYWHPLISGNSQSVHKSGQSVKGKVICETVADDLEYHLTGEL